VKRRPLTDAEKDALLWLPGDGSARLWRRGEAGLPRQVGFNGLRVLRLAAQKALPRNGAPEPGGTVRWLTPEGIDARKALLS
jgi:hypothetical protein